MATMRRAVICLLGGLLAALPLAAAAQDGRDEVFLSVEGACPDRVVLASALDASVDVVGTPEAHAWTLFVRSAEAGGGTFMTLEDPDGRAVSRLLPPEDCSTLATVITLIVERQVEALTVAAEPPERAQTAHPEPEQPDAASVWLRLEAWGGARLLVDPGVLLGSLAIGAGLEWEAGFAVTVGATVHTPWTVSQLDEELAFVLTGATLRLAWAFEVDTHLAVSPRIRFDANAVRVESGITRAEPTWRFSAQLGPGLAVAWRLDPVVELWAALDALFGLNIDRYRVEPVGEVARTSWLVLGLQVGAAFRVF